jgi:hypothetical protein
MLLMTYCFLQKITNNLHVGVALSGNNMATLSNSQPWVLYMFIKRQLKRVRRAIVIDDTRSRFEKDDYVCTTEN